MSAAPECLPPDPHPVRPDFEVPAKACDCHFHIFGPYDRYPLAEKRLFTPPQATYADCLEMHDALSIERGVVIHSSVHGTDMAVCYDALVALDGRWRGIALIDADTDARELGRLDEAGFRGVRLNFVDLGATAAALEAVAARVKPFGWHVQLLATLEHIEALVPYIRELPVPCVIDHMGFTRTPKGTAHPGFQALLAMARESQCWVKLAGADRVGHPAHAYRDAKPFMQALVDANRDRLVWGTDWPHVGKKAMPNDGMLFNLFGAWVPDAETRRRILVDNPAALYGFN